MSKLQWLLALDYIVSGMVFLMMLPAFFFLSAVYAATMVIRKYLNRHEDSYIENSNDEMSA